MEGYGIGWKKGSPSSLGLLINATKERPRGYSLKKIQENNEAEIMQVVLEEARSSYPAEIIVELQSESMEQLEGNVVRIVEWITLWLKNREDSGMEKM
jgi:broad-specificity NMP kinase